MPKDSSRSSALWLAVTFFICLTLTLLVRASTPAQAPASAHVLSQVKKLFVEPLGHGALGNEFRERVIARLRKDGQIAVVDSREQADAVVTGSGEIWVTGHASSTPHNPSATQQSVYSGYLSARVTSKNNEVLWSYLVTPRKFAWGGIVHDLADSLTAKLLAARAESGDTNSAGTSTNATSVLLRGAGATFPAPLYQKWFQSFQEGQPSRRVNYDAVGSEKGIQQLAAGELDFAASDMPLSDERLSKLGIKLQHFASVAGAVVPVYNLPGIARPLNFTPETLTEIYLGKIRRWDDPKIREYNKGVSLPDSEIVVVHRSDGSGTTFVWSDFLSKVSPEWKASVGSGSQLKWPIGVGAERSEGVAVAVHEFPNSIGYVEMVFALQHQLSFGAVRNPAGVFVRADLASVTAAALSASENMTSDFRVSITNAPGAKAYPVASFTWLLLPENGDASRKAAIAELIRWILTDGQRECSELGYAPLPREVVKRELEALKATGN